MKFENSKMETINEYLSKLRKSSLKTIYYGIGNCYICLLGDKVIIGEVIFAQRHTITLKNAISTNNWQSVIDYLSENSNTLHNLVIHKNSGGGNTEYIKLKKGDILNAALIDYPKFTLWQKLKFLFTAKNWLKIKC